VSEEATLLREGRLRERAQTRFYRRLAGDAELAGDLAAAERLNDLLADEQHHVSRLTARLLEMGEAPGESAGAQEGRGLEGWEEEARRREADEIGWYEDALKRVPDGPTRSILREILVSERHHYEQLAGKWMPAAPQGSEDDGR